jgi:predicted alpha/beta-hydrolase family hydrolase
VVKKARDVEVETPQGPGRASVHRPKEAALGTLVLGHGAGGQGWSGDLLAVTGAAISAGWTVALVDQPWRLAGRRVATPPATLDAAWVPIVRALMSGAGALPRPLVVGGRSAGARVACRTAVEVGADAVLCLSFPLHPPGKPERSRADELRLPVEAGLPLHVVQGERDPFGTPGEVRAVLERAGYVTGAAGGHGFAKDPQDVAEAAVAFLCTVTPTPSSG